MDELQSKLESWLQARMPGALHIELCPLARPGTGASSETQLFDLHWTVTGEPQSMGVVLRSAPRGRGVFPSYDLALQFRLMRALHEHTDIPMVKVLWLEETPAVIGAPFFFMQRLEGDVPQDFPSYHASGCYFEATPAVRHKMWRGCLDALAKVHGADWQRLGLAFVGQPGSGTDPVARQLAFWERYLNHWVKDDAAESYPTLEAALGWLKAHVYVPARVALGWGDAKLGNVLYSRPDRNVLTLLDWENAFIGDPELDLASLYFSDLRAAAGQGITPLAGTPSKDELIARYEELTATRVTHFFFNEVLATFWRGAVQVRIMKDWRQKGMAIPDEMLRNNFPTQHLTHLLELPAPKA